MAKYLLDSPFDPRETLKLKGRVGHFEIFYCAKTGKFCAMFWKRSTNKRILYPFNRETEETIISHALARVPEDWEGEPNSPDEGGITYINRDLWGDIVVYQDSVFSYAVAYEELRRVLAAGQAVHLLNDDDKRVGVLVLEGDEVRVGQ